VANLVARTPCEGLLPVTIGSVTLSEVVIERMAAVAPFKGKEGAVSAALKEACDIVFPAPNRTSSKGDARAVWAGQGRANVIGCDLPDLSGLAAVTDQGDGVAAVKIEGDGAEAVLARLVPLDLRAATFKRGHTARSLVNHMAASITRLGPKSFEVMVMRSMAQTLVHELTEAAEGVAARG
jgi:heterotetrameric sarcosine oxidase gamma subunit